ncbi:MAG: TlpA disulfide reductase family protein [Myxococcota bacterium]
MLRFSLAVLLTGALACAHSPRSAPVNLDGVWHAQLESPGGPLPFGLEVRGRRAWVRNGEERAEATGVRREGKAILFDFALYDAQIRAEANEDGSRMQGEWSYPDWGARRQLRFSAARGSRRRFEAAAPQGTATGIWRVQFVDDDGEEPARAQFTQFGDGTVTGTFLTPTGDYRYLEGALDGNTLRLSCFDGAHAFLFTAKLSGPDALDGQFWSANHYRATWTAERVARVEDAPLPDPYGLASLTSSDRKLSFAFEDIEGQRVDMADPRFRGKVVLVDIFGTWCPNCNDQAPYLAKWHQRYRERGLEMVGIAYEVSGDAERDREMLRRWRDHHALEFPLLLGGVKDKRRAGQTLPDLSAVVAYPTTIFVGRDGTVRAVHTGFAGPGTGSAHTSMIREIEGRIEQLLAETLD